MVVQYEAFKAYSLEDLRKTFNSASLPSPGGLGKEDLLEALKMVMAWENLDMSEVEKDCRECMDGKLPARIESTTDDEQRRSMLVRHLLFAKYKSKYEAMGIPVDRLGVSQAMDVHAEFNVFDEETDEQLLLSLHGMALPLSADTPREHLIWWMRKMVVWSTLPILEVFNECKVCGIPTHGFSQEIDEEELRDFLVVRLMMKHQHDRRSQELQAIESIRQESCVAEHATSSGVPMPDA